MKYWWDGSKCEKKKIPRVIFPYYAWGYDEEKIKKFVERKKLIPKGLSNPLLTNMTLIPLMGFVDVAKFGYSSYEPEFATLIRQGKASRKTWLYTYEILEYAFKTGHFIGKSIESSLDTLNLKKSDVGLT